MPERKTQPLASLPVGAAVASAAPAKPEPCTGKFLVSDAAIFHRTAGYAAEPYDALLHGNNFLPDTWLKSQAPAVYVYGCANGVLTTIMARLLQAPSPAALCVICTTANEKSLRSAS